MAKTKVNEPVEKEDTNFFSKTYKRMEGGYNKFSAWVSGIGIPLDKFNDYLNSKGVPAFALMGSLLLVIILFILFLLIWGLNSGVNATFTIQDPNGVALSNIDVTFKDISGTSGKSFNDTLSNGETKKLKLKVGKTYKISAIDPTDTLPNKYFEQAITSKDQIIKIIFDEDVVIGTVKLKVLDSETNKIIGGTTAVALYTLNGVDQNISGILDDSYNLNLNVPMNKNMTLIISADKYQDTKIENFKLNDSEEVREVKLNISSALFEGKSKVTFIVMDKDNKPLDDAVIKVYNLAGTLIDEGVSANGRALLAIDSGETITYTVSKEGYRTATSDENKSYRILNDEETYTINLELGGTNLLVKVMDSTEVLPISGSTVSIYTLLGQKIDSNATDFSGNVNFTGLEVDSDVYVVGCKDTYFCSNTKVSLKSTNQLDLKLEKITVDNSALLYVFVVDGKNLPLTSARISLFQINGTTEVPYGDEMLVDVQGGISLPLKIDSKYLVIARSGDVNDFEYITISKTKENKLIFVLNEASKIMTLDLLNLDGTKINSGHVTVTTKDGTVLYDSDVNSDAVMFETKGYNDYIIDYTDVNGNKTTTSMSADNGNLLTMTIRPKTIGNNPVVEFTGILNEKGEKVTYIAKDKDYFLTFDVTFPEGAVAGGFHIRAGEDSETDSEDMSYGITGFAADSTRFRYSTTYNPEPNPGNQSLDVLNSGSEGEINKWFEVEWKDSKQLSSKQIKVRVKATELLNYKLKFNYRAWNVNERSYYRDPKDATLGTAFSTSRKEGLYAETKMIEVDLFDIPLNCNDDVCVAYEFIDSNLNRYTPSEFFALNKDIYAVEATIFSEKNREITMDAETSNTLPIISFVSSADNLNFPSNYNTETMNELKIVKDKIIISGGQRQKAYFFFVTKNIGVSYINFKVSGGGIETTSEKLSFNITERRDLRVIFNPDYIVPYGSSLNVEVYDSATGVPIENALLTVSDEKGQFITSVKGTSANGKNGKYYFNTKFVVNKINVLVTAHGYTPYTKELVVADDTILSGPKEIVLNLGETEITDSVLFKLKNLSDYGITNITVGEIIWVDPVDTLTLDIKGPIGISKKGEGEFTATATVASSMKFKSASAKIPIYGLYGNRQVAKIVNARIIRGVQANDCLVIKPQKIETYVGKEKDAENNIPILVQNSCDKTLIITPELKTIKSTSNNLLDIGLTQLTILSGEEKEYMVNIKNTADRKQIKTYNYEIVWKNQYYSTPNTELKISLLDLSKALWAAPPIIYVPIVQLTDQEAGITSSRFMIKNIGSVPITDIQLSVYPQVKSANIGVTEYPREVEVLLPGKEIPIDLQFEVKINKPTLDDVYYTITGKAVGVKDPITTKVTVIFVISSPNCIKASPKNLDFTMNIGETKTRNITLTNQCAEPIVVMGIDKSDNLYNETFGQNPLMLYPVSGTLMGNVLPMGASATYALRLTANNYGGSPLMPLKIWGVTATSKGNTLSESILVSININSENQDDLIDKDQVTTIDVPVCGKTDEIRSLSFPIVATGECTGTNGYCDAYSASELILKKVDELSKNVASIAAHYGNKVSSTGCVETSKKGYCEITNLGNIKSPPISFTFYLQNDVISPDVLSAILSKSNYSFKNYMVELSPYEKMPTNVYGVLASGNKIMISPGFQGCGRYKVTIDGVIASDYDKLYPERAYYYVLIEDYKETAQCTKNVENFLNYMPWDRKLTKSNPESTWLTVFTGDENLGKAVAKNVFTDELRYAKTTSLSSKNNKLNMQIGKVTEDPSALARLFFVDTSVVIEPQPETVNIFINDVYAIDNKKKLPENVISDATKVISALLTKEDVAETCISEDGDSLLILKLISAGDLKFSPSNDVTIPISVNEQCKDYNIVSGISETIKINYTSPDSLKTYFKYNGQVYDDNLTIDLEKGRDANFTVCFAPTVPEVYLFVGKEVTLSAKSIYVTSGKLGHREAIAKIKLTSCGVPPVNILKETNKLISNIDKKPITMPYTMYALVDWNKSYSTQDTETFCETLSKFNAANPDAALFFNYKKGDCQLDTQKAEKQARLSKATTNAGIYGRSCMVACGLCVTLMDATLSWIPIFGQTKYIKDILWDCGLGCGIPTLSIFTDTAYDVSISEALDKYIFSKLFNGAKPVQAITEKIGDVFATISNSFATPGATGVSTVISGSMAGKRMFSATPLGNNKVAVYDDAVSGYTIVPASPGAPEVPGTPLIPAVPGTPGTTGTPLIPATPGTPETIIPGTPATLDEFVPNAAVNITSVPNLELQTERYVSYFTHTGAYQYQKPVAGVITSTPSTAAFTSAEAEFDDIVMRLNAGGTFHADTFNNLTKNELNIFTEFAEKGTYLPAPGTTGTMAIPSPATFKQKLLTYQAQKFTFVPGTAGTPAAVIPATPGTPEIPATPGTPGTPGTPEIPATTGTPAIDPTDQLNVLPKTDYDDMIKGMDTQIKKFAASEKLIDEKIAQLNKGSKWNKFGTNRELKKLTDSKKAIGAAKTKLTDLQASITKNAKVDPADATQMLVDNDGLKGVDDLHDVYSSGDEVLLKQKPGAVKKLTNFGAGLVRGVACTLVGNWAGSQMLDSQGVTGLSNSVVLGNTITFNKNTLYMITLDKNPDYDVNAVDNEKSEAEKRAMYIINVEKYTGNTPIADDKRIDSCVIPGAVSIINNTVTPNPNPNPTPNPVPGPNPTPRPR